MNTDTIKAMAGIVGMLNPALGAIATFASGFLGDKASDKVVKITGAVTDAVSVYKAVAPFFEKFGNDEDFTPEDVTAALAGMDDKIAAFDAAIAAQGGG